MRILSTQLVNYRQYENFSTSFGPGVNLILGPMGSGKSTIVDGIRYGLTGTLEDSKDGELRWGADRGSVAVAFEHAGKQGKILRSLDSSRMSLEYDGRVCRSAREAGALMNDLLGVSADVMNRFVFVRQGRLTDLVEETPAERAKLFGVLVGTDRCERLYTLLGAQLGKPNYQAMRLAQPAAEIQAELDHENQALSQLDAEIQQFTQTLADIDVPGCRQRLIKAEAIIARRDHPDTGVAAQLRALDAVRKQLDTAIYQRDAMTLQLESARPQLKALEAEAAQATTAINAAGQTRMLITQRQKALKDLDQLEAEFQANTEPPVFDVRDEWEKTEAQALAEAVAQLTQLRQFVNGFKGPGCCPTCGTTTIVDTTGVTVNIQDQVKDYQQRLAAEEPGVEARRKALTQYQKDLAASTSRHTQWSTWHQGWEKRLAQVESTLQSIPDDLVMPDLAAQQQLTAQYASALRSFQEDEAKLRELDIQVKTLGVRESGLAAICAELASLTVETDPQELRELVNTAAQVEIDLGRLQGERASRARVLTAIQARLDTAQQAEAHNSQVVAYRATLERAREVLHRDNYPAEIARRYFEQIVCGWNQLVSTLTGRFTVSLASTSDIVVNWPSGSATVAKASGGEKACLSVAFLLHVNRMFASHVGLLVLDEPTYGMDQPTLNEFRQLLEQVDRYTQSTGMQVLVVTHEQQLMESCRQVIRVGE